MKVTLSYALVSVEDAPVWLDAIGRYKLMTRKTPEEIKREKEYKIRMHRDKIKVNKYRFEDKSVMQRDPNNPNILYFMTGLWPKVKDALDEHGETYEIVDMRDPAKKPAIDFKAIEGTEFRENQDVALAMIATADCGIINTSVGFGKTWLIAVICKAFPTLNIVVTTDSASVVETNYEYIKKVLPKEVGILKNGKDTTLGKRIIVTTLKSLSKIPTTEVDLLLVDECHAIGDNLAGETIKKFYFARKFGFSATPIRNDGSGIVLESLLGPIILQMSYQEAVAAGMVTPMKYVMLPCYRGAAALKTMSKDNDAVLKRLSYWSNFGRNHIIAEFVRDLWNTTDAQMLVVVSALEHAIRLHMIMPWMIVAYSGAMDLDRLRKVFPERKYPMLDFSKYKLTASGLSRMRNAFAKGTLRGVISTYVFRQGVNFPHLRVLIRADSVTSEIAGIQIPGRLSRLDEGKDYGYLVDLYDGFCDWAKARSQDRIAQYEKQGWINISKEELLNDLRTESGEQSDDAAGDEAGEAESGGLGD